MNSTAISKRTAILVPINFSPREHNRNFYWLLHHPNKFSRPDNFAMFMSTMWLNLKQFSLDCAEYSKPRLDCPKDVIAEVPPGRDEAFVTFDQPSTDLDWFRYVRSKPSWGTRLEANLKSGVHEITFYARHPVSKKQTTCVLRITIKGSFSAGVD